MADKNMLALMPAIVNGPKTGSGESLLLLWAKYLVANQELDYRRISNSEVALTSREKLRLIIDDYRQKNGYDAKDTSCDFPARLMALLDT